MPSRAMSLRFKLAFWFVLVFCLIQTTLLGGVVFFRGEMIRRSLDDALAGSAEAMVDNILAAEVEWDEQRTLPLVPAGAGFVLYALRDQGGDVLVDWNVPDVRLLPFSAWEVVPAGPLGGVHTSIGQERAAELTGNPQKLRLITLPFRYRDQLYFFQAAVRDQAMERLLGPFFDLVAIGAPVGLLAAMIAAWVIAGRAVAPIRQFSRAARQVSPTSLGERFQVQTGDQEVERLESELNSALERLEAGYRAQDQFISNISHELRTPIAALISQAQVAKMGARSLEKGYAFVDQTERLLKRLGRLVDSFLLLARADPRKDRPSGSVAVVDIVLGCVQGCRMHAEENQVRLIPNLVDSQDEAGDLLVDGDPELLQTMVENLVHNAISHSARGSQVAIDVEGAGAAVKIAVSDQGPGIPEDYLERIFDRFVQAPTSSSRRDGVGLGLAIVDSIARLHAGTISVRNNAGGGCSFVVSLPRSAQAEE